MTNRILMSTSSDLTSPVAAPLGPPTADLYRLLVESVADYAIFHLDPDGIVTSWNVGAERIKGYRAPEIIGRHFSVLYQHDDVAAGEPEKMLQRALANGRFEEERQRVRKDGTSFWALVTVTALYDGDDHHVGFAEMTRDITELRRTERALRKRAEATLQACEARYHTLFEYAQVGILLADDESVYRDANESACRMLGYSRVEIVGMHASDIVARSETPHISSALSEIHSRMDHQREWQFRRKDGSVFPADVVATKMPDGTVLGMIRDISDRKLAEEYREHLTAIVESSGDAIVGKDMDGVVTSWNSGAEAIFGYTAAEMIGRPVSLLIPDDRCEEEAIILDRLRRGERVEALETVRQTKDGRLIDVSVTISPIRDGDGRIVGASKIAREITAMKERGREITRLSRLYAALSHVNQAIVWTQDRDELFRKVCKALVDHGGFRMAWVGWHMPETHRLLPVAEWGDENGYLQSIEVYVDDSPQGQGPSGQAFRTGRPYICNDVLGDPATALWRPELVRRGFRASAAFPIRMKGEVCGTLSVYADTGDYFHGKEISLLEEAATDVSFALENFARDEARRQAEQTLRNEMSFSDTMIESMPGIVYFYDVDGRFLRWNRNFESVSGYSRDEVARMHPRDFFTEVDKPRVEQSVAEVFATGESSLEASFVSKDGTSTRYFFTGRHVVFDGKSCLVGVGIDISDRKRAEEGLAESERRYRELVENANSIILRWNADGRITFLNEFGQRFFGWSAAEIVGKHIADTIVPPIESGGRDLRQMVDDIRAAPEAFEQNINENVRRNGERIWVAWTNRVVRDSEGRLVELLGVGTDVTQRRRAEMALREAELRFHTLFEQTPVGIFVVDPETQAIVECNQQGARQLGYTVEEISALRLPDIDATETSGEPAEHLARTVREGRDQFETRHRTKSGEIRDVFVSARLLELSGRGVIHCVCVDVTDRVRAEAKVRESEAHLAEAQRIAKMGSWELDIARNRLTWSDQIYEMFGIPASQFQASYEAFFQFVHPEDRDRVQAAQQAAVAGVSRLDVEHRIVLLDGTEKMVHELANLKTDDTGAPRFLSGTVHDITDRMRMEAEREKRIRAEAADRIKSAFLATMSHELRTPLNSIIGFTGIVLQGLAGPLTAEQTKQLGMVRGSARHLLDLINDVLDISKIEAGQLEVRSEAFELPASIERVVAMVRPLAEKKGLAVTTNVAPDLREVLSDQRRVEQILLNLLNNAIKFTERGGVTLTAEYVAAHRTSPESPPVAAVRLCVADTGPGIKPVDLGTLFQPFRQLDTGLSRQHEGTGLGLAISRRLTELLGGQISAASEWQHGSAFTVILPLRNTDGTEA